MFIVLLVIGLVGCLGILYFNSSFSSQNTDKAQTAEFERSYEVDEDRGSPAGSERLGNRNRRVAENKSSVVSWSVKLLFVLFFLASLVFNIFFIRKGHMSDLISRIGGGTGGYSDKDERKRELDTSFITAPLRDENDRLRSTNSKQEKEIKRLEEEARQFKAHIERLIQKRSPEEISSKPEVASTEASYSTPLPTVPVEEPSTSVDLQPVVVKAFFEGPYDEGKFSVDSGADERKFRYLYKIEYNNSNPTSGNLYLEPTQIELDILKNYSDNILKPACTYSNPFHSGLNGIKQLSPGKVIRQGDDWVVKEKVQIKFI